MKLYFGGTCQGQDVVARNENPTATFCFDLNQQILQQVQTHQDINVFAETLVSENPDTVFIADEVGNGIVPVDPQMRTYREAVGKILCLIAKNSDSVTRVICGIGIRIK